MSFFAPPLPRILAHRGLAVDAPENTLLAFARALAAGAEYIETDVHLTADGVVVISHDPDLRRVAGQDSKLADLTMPDLRRVDLGEGQTFPTLAEALDGFPDARFNIDVKARAAAEPTARVVSEARAGDRVLITSFDEATRRAAVRDLPGVATSASRSRVAAALAGVKLRQPWLVKLALTGVDAVQAPLRQGPIPVVTPAFVRLVHAAGVEVHVWTVNDEPGIRRLLDLGVDGIVTDRADLALPIAAEYRRPPD